MHQLEDDADDDRDSFFNKAGEEEEGGAPALLSSMLAQYVQKESQQTFKGKHGRKRLVLVVNHINDITQMEWGKHADPNATTAKALELFTLADDLQWSSSPTLKSLRDCAIRWAAAVMRLYIYIDNVETESAFGMDQESRTLRVEMKQKMNDSLRRINAFRLFLEAQLSVQQAQDKSSACMGVTADLDLDNLVSPELTAHSMRNPQSHILSYLLHRLGHMGYAKMGNHLVQQVYVHDPKTKQAVATHAWRVIEGSKEQHGECLSLETFCWEQVNRVTENPMW